MDVVTLYNLALSEVGQQHTVAETTEPSLEAELCNRWFDYVSQMTFSLAPWPEVTAFARLALLRERDPQAAWQPADPAPNFRYVFAPPSDLIRPFHLQSFGRFHYQAGTISCNELQPILFYIRKEPNLSKWGIDLFSAVMYILASKIAHPLTGKPDLAITLMQKAELLAADAVVRALHTLDQKLTSDPEWITARGFGQSLPRERYFFPFTAANFETTA